MARRKRWSGLGQLGRIPSFRGRLLHDIWVRDEFSENVPDEYASKQANYGFELFKPRDTKTHYCDMEDLLDLLGDGRLYAKSEDIVKHWRKRTVFNDDGYAESISREGHLKLESQEYFSPVSELSVRKINEERTMPGFASTRTLYYSIPDLNGKMVWKEYVLARRYLSPEVLPKIEAKVKRGELFTRRKMRCTN